VTQVTKGPFDLIPMDNQITEIDGGTPAKLPVVFRQEMLILAITDDPFGESRERYLVAGMDDFLTT
jgi:CheY-like chemotaxis protein